MFTTSLWTPAVRLLSIAVGSLCTGSHPPLLAILGMRFRALSTAGSKSLMSSCSTQPTPGDSAAAAFAARPAAPASVGAYDPEYVDMIEVGLKAQAFDDRMRLNVSAYTSDYEDYQAQVNRVGNAFDTRVLNAAEAEIDGFEVELTALFSPWLRVVATLGYTDAEITEVDLDPSLEANFAKGSRLPYVSKVTYSISPQAMWPLANGSSLMLRADYAYRDDFYGQIANSPFEKEDGYGLVNARLEFSSPDERWRLALYGINLADKKYTRVRNYYPGFLGFALWNTDRREIGISGRLEF